MFFGIGFAVPTTEICLEPASSVPAYNSHPQTCTQVKQLSILTLLPQRGITAAPLPYARRVLGKRATAFSASWIQQTEGTRLPITLKKLRDIWLAPPVQPDTTRSLFHISILLVSAMVVVVPTFVFVHPTALSRGVSSWRDTGGSGSASSALDEGGDFRLYFGASS